MRIKSSLERLLNTIWYEQSVGWIVLWPLSLLFGLVVSMRRYSYQRGWRRVYRAAVPVVVAGNITIGGVGKTPLVIYLAELLVSRGLKPGIVTRGYGRNTGYPAPLVVDAKSTPDKVGDEALLMYQRLGIPVVVDAKRGRAARLLEDYAVDIILSDDGLQHYALARDIEIAIVDGTRELGNGRLLPAGPLREPVARLESVDFVLTNRVSFGARQNSMCLEELGVVSLHGDQRSSLAQMSESVVHAYAGIGNPERFFETLRQAGLRLIEHAFPDHHAFSQSDFANSQGAVILMTEKDAVKCRELPLENAWFLQVKAVVSADFESEFISRIETILSSK